MSRLLGGLVSKEMPKEVVKNVSDHSKKSSRALVIMWEGSSLLVIDEMMKEYDLL